ncbi:MAG: DUF1949 domain-containing protein [Clostridia bacterium]|nr:DUF1949 domain-containing protein [Clostridia bacterium]
MKDYLTVAREYQNELIIKRSRFIATIAPVQNHESAMIWVLGIKAKCNDATHNCYAFISDELGQEVKFGDDGEPQGTAGQPILEVLRKNQLFRTAIVVTRYFGGVKLGASGLVGAYSSSAAGAVSQCEKVMMVYSDWAYIEADYSLKGKIDAAIIKNEGRIISTSYTNSVKTELIVPRRNTEHMINMLADITSGKGEIIITKNGYYPY